MPVRKGGSAADGDHVAAGLVTFPEGMCFRFAVHRKFEKTGDLLIVGTCAECVPEIHLEMAAQAGTELPIASQAQLVAAVAEM